MLNTQVGQPYSAVNLNEDRDLVQTYYLSRGYDNAEVEPLPAKRPAITRCGRCHHEDRAGQAVLRA